LLRSILLTVLGILLSSPANSLTVQLRSADGDSVFHAEQGDTVAIHVSVDSEGESITGFELFLGYDPALLLPIDTNPAVAGNQPAVTTGALGQVFADSIILVDANTSAIHYAEVSLVGGTVSGDVFSVQFELVEQTSGTSPIRVLQDLSAGVSSLYTLADRDGESVVIPAAVGVVYQDLPPVFSELAPFVVEEDGGPGFLASGLVTDESPVASLVFRFVASDSTTSVTTDADSLRFHTPANFAGDVTGTLVVQDPAGSADSTAITLTVTAVNDSPEIDTSAYVDTVTVGAEPVVMTLVGSDVDDDASSLFWFALVAGDSLTAVVNGEEVTLTAEAGWRGLTTVTLQLADPGGEVDTHALVVRGASILGDFDGSGAVDFGDFLLFAGAFGNPDADPKFDLDGSGAVDFPDFLLFVERFGQS